MNIGFYDPISERWIKPRPEKPVEAVDPVSLGEALLNAIAADALKKRNDKIWEYLKQSAEGCNAAPVAESPIVTSDPPEYVEPSAPVMIMQERVFFANSGVEIYYTAGSSDSWATLPGTGSAPLAVEPSPEYEAVESLGYIYWKPKDGQCSGQQE